MRKNELEVWIRQVLDRVHRREHTEDTRVELKTEWPQDPARAARRLAGHANAAQGGPILWIIGADEKTGVVGGVPTGDLDAWYRAVAACFDEMAPSMLLGLAVPFNETTVIGLLFETDRAPYVVKNPAGGPVSHETPWRDATGIRSARRADLLMLLSPLQRLPSVDWRSAQLRISPQLQPPGVSSWVSVDVQFYIVPARGELIVLPYYKCSVQAYVPGLIEPTRLATLAMRPPGGTMRSAVVERMGGGVRGSATIEETANEVVVAGPGMLRLSASSTVPTVRVDDSHTTALVTVTLGFAEITASVRRDFALVRTEPDVPSRPGRFSWEWQSDS